ncbi:MerR family transcriptional regulator [uncultured Roseobacter sp.]|uniref:helix-turn-helix domain-containing protein n=1 Tax=uncultured Roseobacter sp. TaxID=114847 RepID=UPI0026018B3E|nr:MerR family transcriptional regulator [uncultured Roseobacter sp.]
MEEFVHIGKLAERLGITTRALRFYEYNGLLKSQRLSEKGQSRRLYSPEMCERARRIVLARKAGVSVAAICDNYPLEQLDLVIPHRVFLAMKVENIQLIKGLGEKNTMIDQICFGNLEREGVFCGPPDEIT